MNLIFATNNHHKLNEIRQLIGRRVKIYSLDESGFHGEIPEDYESLEENASQKAWYVHHLIKRNCFADDTGLEVEALGGGPGVYSARYSRIGDNKYSELDIVEGNICKLLDNLRNIKNRQARFRTVISLVLDGKEHQFEGIVNGIILEEKFGSEGFGYDPVFLPDGYSRTFAQMSLTEKNEISHRSIAIKKLVNFLNDL
jgi:XTP/dITP diphosphohydrolase